MKKLYPKLAWQNLVKNGRFTLPYLLTILASSGAFYILNALANATDLPESIRYIYLTAFLRFGSIIVGLFAIIFLFYTNSFLMKQRKRELGLYNVLGMGKRHIARVLAWETLYHALLGIVSGLAVGMLFQRGVTALLGRLVRQALPFGFYISWSGVAVTAILFTAILFVNLLVNLKRIHGQNPIELMREGSAGEREPKTRYILALLGVVALGTGYAIALRVQNAVEALGLYFIAVFLVIIGTYCLFTAVSIAVLKLMRKNKRFYYQTNHFIGLSGMLYRMKRNAVGLANICILSTMVLVMVSGTLALYLGAEDALNDQYPADVNVRVRYYMTEEEPFQPQVMAALLDDVLAQQGQQAGPAVSYTTLEMSLGLVDGGELRCTGGENEPLHYLPVTVLTAADYAALSGTAAPQLQGGQVLLYSEGFKLADAFQVTFAAAEAETLSFSVVQRLESFPTVARAHVGSVRSTTDQCYIVVADESVLAALCRGEALVNQDNAPLVTWFGQVDLAGDDLTQGAMELETALMERMTGEEQEDGTVVPTQVGSWQSMGVTSRGETARELYALNGGFFFLGIFLGFLFLLAAVLIIYYKQITEGYEDRGRFQIMQQVGLEQREIRRSINSQVLVVFFAPLLVAAVHVAFDFPLVKLLLTLFGLTNATLTLLCTVGTLLAFMAVYSIVYILTARVYYRIVS